jgi:prepilin-type N-terminal cleavage/methylation domain-containing protein
MNRNRNRRSGFTLIETMLVLVLIALAGAFFYPQVAEILTGGKAATAKALQSQLSNWYSKWTSVGGTHGVGATDDNQAQLAFNLMTIMNSEVGSTNNLQAGDPTAARDTVSTTEINSRLIREQINRSFTAPASHTPESTGVAGPYVLYDNQFLIRFQARSNKTGVWTVVVMN